jgi:hypothetical protein
MLVLDSSNFKWKISSWKIKEERKFSLLKYFRSEKLSQFQLQWVSIGQFDIPEMKAILRENFIEDDEFYEEAGVGLSDIERIESIEDAVGIFNLFNMNAIDG